MSRDTPLNLLFLSDNTNLMTSLIVKGVLNACQALGWTLRWRETHVFKERFSEIGGIVAMMNLKQLLELRRHMPKGAPLVAIGGITLDTSIPTVAADPIEIGRLTAGHLVEQGLNHFATVDVLDSPVTKLRQGAFEAAILAKLPEARLASFDVPEGERVFVGGETGRRFLQFLKEQPLPLGIMAGNDYIAASCLEAIREAGFRVPGQIAVVGSLNDPVYSQIVMPLTSTKVDFERMGSVSVQMVERTLAEGKAPASEFIPVSLVVRRSSQVRLMGDERIVKAVEILQARYAEEISLPQLARWCGMSKTGFALAFHRAVGLPPMQYLNRLRLDLASRWLVESNLSVAAIAEKVGVADPAYFTRIFRKYFGLTPRAYSQSH